MKILLLGKNGQVGRALQKTLLPLGELIALGRDDLDLMQLTELPVKLAAIRPTIIVNAAAYTAVDKAENDFSGCHLLNVAAVEIIAQYASANGALLVHYSTDYVFDGEKSGAYLETDSPAPLNVYGLTKLAGENAILQSQCKALIFRTSWVVSPDGNNFIKTILRLAKERDSLRVVDDQHGAPTSAQLIAEVTALAIVASQSQTIEYGLYHLAAAHNTTWYQLAVAVLERSLLNGRAYRLATSGIEAIASAQYPVIAERPKNSCLNTTKLSRMLQFDFLDWKIGVNAVLDQLVQAELKL